MKPVIALVGRPNVGKSTLFNYLTKSKDALVADQPGLTRDRIYGITRRFDDRYIVIDTGGIAPVDPSNEKNEINVAITEQAWLAIEESDVVFFIVDCTKGLVPQDVDIFKKIRNSNQKIFIIVNKSDFNPQNKLTNEFYELGAQNVFEISAKSGKGVRDIFSELEIIFPIKEEESVEEAKNASIKVALIGKPNVGKSTLANALIGEERFVTSEIPGTTRDSISVPIEKFGTQFELIDTAGVRKRSKVHDLVEKFSVVKTLQAIEYAHVVVLMLDGRSKFSEQDARLAGLVLESGRAVVLAINKIDSCSKQDYKSIRKGFDLKLHFLDFAERLFISAKKKEGITKLLHAVKRAYQSANIEVNTGELNRILESALEDFQPPLIRGRRIRLKYIAQVNKCPPTFSIHGNQIGKIPAPYKRYLVNYFRKTLRLVGTPINLVFKQPDNPYAGKHNKLTPRQQRHRARLIKRVKMR